MYISLLVVQATVQIKQGHASTPLSYPAHVTEVCMKGTVVVRCKHKVKQGVLHGKHRKQQCKKEQKEREDTHTHARTHARTRTQALEAREEIQPGPCNTLSPRSPVRLYLVEAVPLNVCRVDFPQKVLHRTHRIRLCPFLLCSCQPCELRARVCMCVCVCTRARASVCVVESNQNHHLVLHNLEKERNNDGNTWPAIQKVTHMSAF